MRTTLDIDDDVVVAARELAAGERRSLGAVISELARRGLTPARVEAATGSCPMAYHSLTTTFPPSSVTAR